MYPDYSFNYYHCYYYFEMRFCYVARASLEFEILLISPFWSWDDKHVPLCLATIQCLTFREQCF
jgi:hypothetical protein